MLVDDREEIAGFRLRLHGTPHDDLVAIEIITVEFDAQFLAAVELQCRLLAHHRKSGTSVVRRRRGALRCVLVIASVPQDQQASTRLKGCSAAAPSAA